MDATITSIARSPHGYAPETGILIERLSTGNPGDIVTDEELSRMIGRDTRPDGDGYTYLLSAIRYVCRNHGVVWSRRRGEHLLVCQDSAGALTLAQSGVQHIRRAAIRSLDVLATVKHNELTAEQRVAHRATLLQIGAIRTFSRGSTYRQLQRSTVDVVPTKELLRAFVGDSVEA